MGVRRRAVSLHGDELSFWEVGPGDAAGRAAIVKNAGVGTRPDSILRSVSTDIPTAVATEVMLR